MTNNPEPVAHVELVERLTGRARFCRDRGEIKTPELLEGAAAELTRLRAEVERKDEALRALAEGNLGPMPWQAGYDRIRDIARAALKEPNQ